MLASLEYLRIVKGLRTLLENSSLPALPVCRTSRTSGDGSVLVDQHQPVSGNCSSARGIFPLWKTSAIGASVLAYEFALRFGKHTELKKSPSYWGFHNCTAHTSVQVT